MNVVPGVISTPVSTNSKRAVRLMHLKVIDRCSARSIFSQWSRLLDTQGHGYRNDQ